MSLHEEVWGYEKEAGSTTGHFLCTDSQGKKRVSMSPEVSDRLELLIREQFRLRESIRLRESCRIYFRLWMNTLWLILNAWVYGKYRTAANKLKGKKNVRS